MNPRQRFRALLDRLHVGAGGLVYLHTSFSRLAHLELTPHELIDELMAHLGPSGTLVLPSFAWNVDRSARPWKGYADYYRERPPFDVRRTPANIGLIPELFRTYPGVRRSAHYWWSVAARGPLAEEITIGQEEVVFPYGAQSSFGRLYRLPTTILGLGVTLNTTSLAPVVDHELGDEHTQAILSDRLEEGVVVDETGRRTLTRSYWLLPEVVRLIKPERVCSSTGALGGAIRRADHEGTIQFAYPFEAYFTRALALGRAAAAEQQPMPWLDAYPLRPRLSSRAVGAE
jgi:hypothetical protein